MNGIPMRPIRTMRMITVADRISRFAEMRIIRPKKSYYPQSHTLGPMHKEWLLALTCRLLRQAGRV
jgi:hypothetical protein